MVRRSRRTPDIGWERQSVLHKAKACIDRECFYDIPVLHAKVCRSPNAVLIDRKLRKKIWWCLYIRDRQCAAALGLPTRIRDEDCDIELLNEDDFEAEYSGPIMASYFGTQKREHVLYICHMAKLAILLGKIVLREFSPGTSPYTNTDRNTLQISLEAWESALPREMRSNATTGSFWAGILHIAHE